MMRDELVKYLFFHFIHLAFYPIVYVTHLAAYGLSLALNISPDLYRFKGSWLYGLSLFLLSSLAFALALKGARAFSTRSYSATNTPLSTSPSYTTRP